MIVLQLLGVAIGLTLLVLMALAPSIQDWHERTPLVQPLRPQVPVRGRTTSLAG